MERKEFHTDSIELSPSQTAEHGVAVVHAAVNQAGDGFARNVIDNGYLAGSLLRTRRRGGKRICEIGSVEDGILQTPRVGESIRRERETISGRTYDSNEQLPGELDRIEERRRELPHWFDLSPLEQQLISAYYTDSAERRSRSLHPTNLAIWGNAALAGAKAEASIGSNLDPELLSLTDSLKDTLRQRQTQLERHERKNDGRKIAFPRWFLQENQNLDMVAQCLQEVRRKQDTDSLTDLKASSRHIAFHIQPLNHLAWQLKQNGGEPVSDDQIVETQAGFQFQRKYLFLSKPFASIGSKTEADLMQSDLDPLLADLRLRAAHIEALATRGAYRQLFDRIVEATDQTVSSLEGKNFSATQRAAARGRLLLGRFCLPNEPEVTEWYGHRLYNQSLF